MTLDQLAIGQHATITEVHLQGIERWRLFDLGFLPDTVIQCAFVSPLGNPIAYRVRNSLIALRREQAQQIVIHLNEQDTEKGSEL